MKMINNPILRGFNPDPSIIRVKEDYYIATSTFEWFPGVQIHHSRDLIHWDLVARPLNRISQLNMAGNPDSCGVWAPCLSYHQGIFYLVYSNVRSFDGIWKDTPNYLVTTKDILGEWSDPVFLSSKGFDGSLFHDNDGRKWYTSMLTDHRRGKFFGGILLQEYDSNQKKLVGKPQIIFEGTPLGKTEGPHIYKRNGYYYLLTAEGGTEYGHAISLARSKQIQGPYKIHPENPVISTRDFPDHPLQKCGHGDLVMTLSGKWYIVFLVGRPLTKLERCTLGRETAIEEVEWRDNHWLYAVNETPRLSLPSPNEAFSKDATITSHFGASFSSDHLSIHFQSLRIPMEDGWISLKARPGFLRLFGRESLNSLHFQSLIARRVQHFHIEASTCIEFSPTSFQQMAGLVCYYNTAHWFYLHMMGDDDEHSKKLQILVCDNYETKEILKSPIDVTGWDQCYLKVIFNKTDLQFYYAGKPGNWQKIGSRLDGSILSDDYVRDGSHRYRPAFTGAFVGLCCQDLSGEHKHADFDWFEYQEL